MGLAGTKVKQKFGNDPRNTVWSNDTSRFGHSYMEKMGWTPGKGLGLVNHASTSHVKVVIKDDNMGLGAKLARKRNGDAFGDDSHGLDVFQRLLGRLNGKEEEINKELDRQRIGNLIKGNRGIDFVKGEVLQNTWNSNTRSIEDDSVDNESSDSTSSQTKSSDSANLEANSGMEKEKRKSKRKDSDERKYSPKSSTGEKDKQDSKHKNSLETKKEKKDKKEKKEKKEKKDKKDKKDKKEKKDKNKKSEKKERNRSDEKGDKHAIPNKKRKGSSSAESRQTKRIKQKGSNSNGEGEKSSQSHNEEDKKSEKAISSSRLIRSKWIKQKKASVMDARALNEIFMISN